MSCNWNSNSNSPIPLNDVATVRINSNYVLSVELVLQEYRLVIGSRNYLFQGITHRFSTEDQKNANNIQTVEYYCWMK